MSIIREDELNWDEAIWHMERAFEIQPANTTIQNELRRMYGKRDGVEPAKVRLTRGALARMYCRGELYQQAIGELRAALAEDANRYDLQALLARVYMQTGQKVDAADAANAILRKLPLCLEANHIMVEILSGSERATEAATYNQNLVALDPYAKFATPEMPVSQKVADEAITVEKLDWRSMQLAGVSQPQYPEVSEQEEVQPEAEKEEMPDWLESAAVLQATAQSSAPSATPDQSQATQDELAAGEDLIPDWMKAQGWGPVSGDGSSQAEPVMGEAEEAELPDWLKTTAPAAEVVPAEATPSDELPDWLKDMDANAPAEGETAAGKENEFPEWLFGEDGAPAPEAALEAATPSLEKAAELPVETPAEEVSPINEAMVAAFLAESGKPEPEATPSEEEELPAWLQGMAEPEPVAKPDGTGMLPLPDWIEQEEPVEKAAVADELPSWLQEAEAAAPETAEEGEQLPEWLQETPAASVEEQFTAAEATLEEAEPSEAIPEWLQEVTIEAEEAEQPAEEAEMPDWLKDVGFGPSEEVSELPAEEAQVPAWVEDIFAEEAEAPAASEELESLPVAEAEEQAAPLEQVAPLEQAALIEEEPLPDWLKEISEPELEQPVAGQTIAEETPVEAELLAEPEAVESEAEVAVPTLLSESDESFRWLESLAIRQGATEGLILPPEDHDETAPSWVQEVIRQTGMLPPLETVQTAEAAPAVEEVQEHVEQAEQVEEIEAAWQPEEEIEPLSVAPVVEEVEEVEEALPVVEEAEEVEEALPFVEAPPVEEPAAGVAWLEEEVVQPEEAPLVALEAEETLAVALEEEKVEEEAPPEVVSVPTTEVVVEEAPVGEIEEVALPVEKLDLNRASLAELERLPGVGYIQAQAIIEHREKNGPFASVDDLAQIAEISPASLNELQGLFFAKAPEQAIKATKPFKGLDAARSVLLGGDVSSALGEYNRLIMARQSLKEIVADLENATKSHTQDADLWQSLGDAYMRNDQLEEALDAYSKAELFLD